MHVLFNIGATWNWKLHNEELHKFYSSPNTVRMVKSRRMRGAGYAARNREKRNAYKILVRSQKEIDN
jgi:hypothetical protein